MSLSSLEGTPWHVTCLKSDEERKHDKRSCKYYIKGNECTKGGTCRGGRYCTEYKRYDEEENIRQSNTTPEEIRYILEKLKKEESLVQERDIIHIKNIDDGNILKIKILPSATGDEKVIVDKCINKKIGYKFKYKNNNFEIVCLKKKAITMDEKLSKLSKRKKSKLVISDPNNLKEIEKNTEVKKSYKPIAERNDILYFKTQACKKGSPYSKETLKLKTDDNKYKELIERCIGKELGYRCKFNNKMFKLIHIEKNNKSYIIDN